MIKAEIEVYCYKNPKITKSVGKKIFFGERQEEKLLEGLSDSDREKVKEILAWASSKPDAYVKKVFKDIYRVIK